MVTRTWDLPVQLPRLSVSYLTHGQVFSFFGVPPTGGPVDLPHGGVVELYGNNRL
jgi:hypothetical protein